MNRRSTLILAGLCGALISTTAVEAGYTGVVFEQYIHPDYDAPPGTQTWRLYATFDNELDQLSMLGGTIDQPWELYTSTKYFNDDDFGGWWAHNAVFDPMFPFLHYDSYWTIGTDDAGQGADLGITFPAEQPIWTDTMWFADDGGIYRLPEDPLAFAGPDLRVLFGQFTLFNDPSSGGESDDYLLYGKVKIYMFVDGGQSLTVYEDLLLVPGPGGVALIGLAGLIGRRRR